MSRESHITFPCDWMSKKFLGLYNREYRNKKRTMGFHDGVSLYPNVTIGMKPKIGSWDKIKSYPLKAVSKVLNLIPWDEENKYLASEEEIRGYKIDWNGSQIHADEGWDKNEHGTIAWVHFDTKRILATVFVDE